MNSPTWDDICSKYAANGKLKHSRKKPNLKRLSNRGIQISFEFVKKPKQVYSIIPMTAETIVVEKDDNQSENNSRTIPIGYSPIETTQIIANDWKYDRTQHDNDKSCNASNIEKPTTPKTNIIAEKTITSAKNSISTPTITIKKTKNSHNNKMLNPSGKRHPCDIKKSCESMPLVLQKEHYVQQNDNEQKISSTNYSFYKNEELFSKMRKERNVKKKIKSILKPVKYCSSVFLPFVSIFGIFVIMSVFIGSDKNYNPKFHYQAVENDAMSAKLLHKGDSEVSELIPNEMESENPTLTFLKEHDSSNLTTINKNKRAPKLALCVLGNSAIVTNKLGFKRRGRIVNVVKTKNNKISQIGMCTFETDHHELYPASKIVECEASTNSDIQSWKTPFKATTGSLQCKNLKNKFAEQQVVPLQNKPKTAGGSSSSSGRASSASSNVINNQQQTASTTSTAAFLNCKVKDIIKYTTASGAIEEGAIQRIISKTATLTTYEILTQSHSLINIQNTAIKSCTGQTINEKPSTSNRGNAGQSSGIQSTNPQTNPVNTPNTETSSNSGSKNGPQQHVFHNKHELCVYGNYAVFWSTDLRKQQWCKITSVFRADFVHSKFFIHLKCQIENDKREIQLKWDEVDECTINANLLISNPPSPPYPPSSSQTTSSRSAPFLNCMRGDIVKYQSPSGTIYDGTINKIVTKTNRFTEYELVTKWTGGYGTINVKNTNIKLCFTPQQLLNPLNSNTDSQIQDTRKRPAEENNEIGGSAAKTPKLNENPNNNQQPVQQLLSGQKTPNANTPLLSAKTIDKPRISLDSGVDVDEVIEDPASEPTDSEMDSGPNEEEIVEEQEENEYQNYHDLPFKSPTTYGAEKLFNINSQPPEWKWLMSELKGFYGSHETDYPCYVYGYYLDNRFIYYGSSCNLDNRYKSPPDLFSKMALKNVQSVTVSTLWPEGSANLMIASELESLLIMASKMGLLSSKYVINYMIPKPPSLHFQQILTNPNHVDHNKLIAALNQILIWGKNYGRSKIITNTNTVIPKPLPTNLPFYFTGPQMEDYMKITPCTNIVAEKPHDELGFEFVWYINQLKMVYGWKTDHRNYYVYGFVHNSDKCYKYVGRTYNFCSRMWWHFRTAKETLKSLVTNREIKMHNLVLSTNLNMPMSYEIESNLIAASKLNLIKSLDYNLLNHANGMSPSSYFINILNNPSHPDYAKLIKALNVIAENGKLYGATLDPSTITTQGACDPDRKNRGLLMRRLNPTMKSNHNLYQKEWKQTPAGKAWYDEHYGVKNGPYECPFDQRVFKDFYKIQKHLSGFHGDETYDTIEKLREYYEEHKDKTHMKYPVVTKYECPFCAEKLLAAEIIKNKQNEYTNVYNHCRKAHKNEKKCTSRLHEFYKNHPDKIHQVEEKE